MSTQENGKSNKSPAKPSPKVHSRIRETPIAIVGMASLMPDAKALNRYWSNITEKVNSIVDVPASRWSIDDYYDADPKAPDKTYCKRGAFLPEIDFNPMEYGLPPNILEVTDAGQLLSLVVAKDVLEDAGISADSSYDRDRIGCVLGIGGGQKLSASLTARLQYPVIERILRSSGVPENEIQTIIEKYKAHYVPWEENSFPGLLGNVIAGRIANRFNLGGMNSVVDAACASSLSAMKLAVSELLEGHSDMMITGGACADNSIFMYMSFSKTPAFTTDEFIKPFDSESKGMMIGEGIGMVALKRLPDAERDGDRIYATIRGIGSSSDGKFKSIYAPRPQGQAKALRRAYDDAGYAPSTVGMVEAHGTGTAAGDVAEFEGLKEVFATENSDKQHIALGSVKSQIGHLKAAAGVAGLIKSALALHHKVLPPTLSVKQPNPKLGLEDSPFYLNTETRPWVTAEDGSPRRASVSAFGFGGTNFHVAMEEYTAAQSGKYRLNAVAQPSLLTAKDRAQLIAVCQTALTNLRESDSDYTSFIEVTALREIPKDQVRLGFISSSCEEAILRLESALANLEKNVDQESWDTPDGVYFRSEALPHEGAVVALFSGQGSQYVGMGTELACNFPEYLDTLNRMDGEFVKADQPRLSDRVFPIPVFDAKARKANETALQQTQFAQPAIGSFSVGGYKILHAAGFKPDFVAGHSFGELTALWAAGVIKEEDYYVLARARGQAMAAPDDPNFDAGTMAAIMGEVSSLTKDLADFSDVRIANFNSKTQVVIAGPKESIAAACAHLKGVGYKAIPLPVSAAFHTPLVGHAQEPFANAIDAVEFSAPEVPVFSNSTGEAYEANVESIKATLKQHILNSVRFSDELQNLHAAGARVFVEFGPKKVLSPMVANVLADKPHFAVAINANPKKSSDEQLRLAAVQLAVAGLPLSNLDPHQADIPAYNTEKTSPLKIELSAPNYLSPKFVEKRDAVMNDGFKLSTAEPQVIVNEVTVTPPSANGSHKLAQRDEASQSLNPEGLEESLALFYQHERDTLKVHERYLETPKQYSETFHALMDQQMEILKDNPDSALPEGVERSMLSFHENHAETLKIHEQFVEQQAETTRSTLNLLKQHYSLLTGTANPDAAQTTPRVATPKRVEQPAPVVTPAPAAAPEATPVVETVASAPSATDSKQLTESMLAVVAEKTGYPTEMLELSMDMEADLGIDSIKRVEILGAVQEEYPGLPEMNPEVMGELRTLGEIVDYMNSQLDDAPAPQPTPVTNTGIDPAQITKTMLTVVAEKTGYPTEMLELSMDMEADLGIDSIKRVEILGAVQEEYPDMPEMDPEVMSELRTLGEIVSYMEAQSGTTTAPTATNLDATPQTISPDKIIATMMSIVSEKTGYPVDMLELSMDMEADLGIDSIKRVEILGAVQEEYAELPELEAEVMAGLRTLGEIVDYMNAQVAQAGGTAVASTDVVAQPSSSGIDVQKLTQTMLKIVSEKTGYPEDMLELSMDMEADLGIDSIKRVEILGAVQEEHPDLPEVEAEVLAEKKTLDEIVQCFLDSPTTVVAPDPIIAAVESLDIPSMLTRNVALLTSLPLPDSLVETVPSDRCCVLTDDGTPTTGLLSSALVEQGWKVAVLSYPSSICTSSNELNESIVRIELNDLEEATLSDALSAVSDQLGSPSRFIHLDPCCESDAQAKDVLRATFLLAKHLRDALNDTPQGARAAFITVTRLDGQLGYGGGCFNAIPGGLFGLTKTVNLEWPSVFCRVIDIDPAMDPQEAADHIIAECADPNRCVVEVGYTEAGRTTLTPSDTHEETTSQATARIESSPITDESVFIVSGGAKGVTSECVVKLAAKCGGTYILLGRSALEQIPAWANGHLDEAALKKAAMEHLQTTGEKPTPRVINSLVKSIISTRSIEAIIKRVENTGGKAHYLSCDVTDAAALRNGVAALESKTGAVTGIIHGAGVLADRLIEKKTLENFDTVVGTKVEGLSALLGCVDPEKLTHLTLFSSAAGFFGNAAQSDYSIANEILNKKALDFKARYPQCHVTTFNWGPWDGGMVTPELKRHFLERKIEVIPIDEGTDLFVDDLSDVRNEDVQILVGSTMEFDTESASDALEQYEITRDISVHLNPFLSDHCIDGKPVLPMAGVMSWMGGSCEALLPGYKFFSIVDMKMLKGIVFQNGNTERYHLDIAETEKNAERVSLDLMLWSEATDMRVNHYSATVRLVKHLPEAPLYTEFDAAELNAVNGADYYQNGTLFHGPMFQVIERGLNASADKLTLLCTAPKLTVAEQGQFPIATQHLCANDAKFQSLLVWARQFKEAGALPTSFECFELYREIPAGETFHLSLDVSEVTNSKVKGTATLHDEQGRVYSRVLNAETTISKSLSFAAPIS